LDIDRFKQLVARLERESAAAPGAYRAKVAALTLLGFGILLLFLAAAGAGLVVLAGFAVFVALTGGKALIVLIKGSKLFLLLAIPLWFLIKNGIAALFVRFPPPEGREIRRNEAPALFAEIDRMRRVMNGPRFHHVLIVDDVNAAVVQRPAFGLIGWPRNYLLLGLPLLEGMAPLEALAVVAHEYGHLASADGHFGAFIYRLRHTWGTIETAFERIPGWMGRLMTPLLHWYVPYFNAYTL
jgi:Zn-dependent protease with chaperone function